MPSGIYDRNHKATDEEKKAVSKTYRESVAGKEVIKRNRNKPENKAKRKKHDQMKHVKERRKTPEFHAKVNKRMAKPENVEKRRLARLTPKAKARANAYQQRPDVKLRNSKKQRERYLNNKEAIQLADKERIHKKKMIVYNHYSNNDIKCKCCGEKDEVFLSLDHIYNNGAHHRSKCKVTYHWIIKNNFPPIFQVLCMNCNWSRRFGNTCPHEIKSKNRIWNSIISMFTGGWRL